MQAGLSMQYETRRKAREEAAGRSTWMISTIHSTHSTRLLTEKIENKLISNHAPNWNIFPKSVQEFLKYLSVTKFREKARYACIDRSNCHDLNKKKSRFPMQIEIPFLIWDPWMSWKHWKSRPCSLSLQHCYTPAVAMIKRRACHIAKLNDTIIRVWHSMDRNIQPHFFCTAFISCLSSNDSSFHFQSHDYF